MAALLPEGMLRALARIVGVALLAGGVTALVAVVYRWYARLRLPVGLALLVGLGTVAAYLNTTAALGLAIDEADGLLQVSTAVRNVATFAAAGAVAVAGGRLGDRVGRVVSVASGVREFDDELGRVVTAVGRAIAVELPAEIDDIEGYDPEPGATKETLAGKTLLFPRGLTVAELRDRLVTRLKDDYGVGHVDLDLEDDGSVSHLALGRRAAGLGPTLAPGTAAVAIRADPPFAASSGDLVQVWTRGEDSAFVSLAEFRTKQGDVVTLALDELDARDLDPGDEYRLVTLPAGDRFDREFAGLLRAADETFGVATIGTGSPLVGAPVAAIDATVVALRPAEGAVEAIPPRERTLGVGDTVYVVAKPETLRRIDAAAAGAEPS